MPIKLLYTVLTGLFLVAHPFHVSVCDIEYNSENQALQISQRIFIDDLENGLKKFHKMESIEAYKPQDPKQLDSLIEAYLNEKLRVKIDGKAVALNYLGSEVEQDARWCYIEVSGIPSVTKAEITNLVLLEVFEDQENIVHFKANGKLRSFRLNRDKKGTTFEFD